MDYSSPSPLDKLARARLSSASLSGSGVDRPILADLPLPQELVMMSQHSQHSLSSPQPSLTCSHSTSTTTSSTPGDLIAPIHPGALVAHPGPDDLDDDNLFDWSDAPNSKSSLIAWLQNLPAEMNVSTKPHHATSRSWDVNQSASVMLKQQQHHYHKHSPHHHHHRASSLRDCYTPPLEPGVSREESVSDAIRRGAYFVELGQISAGLALWKSAMDQGSIHATILYNLAVESGWLVAKPTAALDTLLNDVDTGKFRQLIATDSPRIADAFYRYGVRQPPPIFRTAMELAAAINPRGASTPPADRRRPSTPSTPFAVPAP